MIHMRTKTHVTARAPRPRDAEKVRASGSSRSAALDPPALERLMGQATPAPLGRRPGGSVPRWGAAAPGGVVGRMPNEASRTAVMGRMSVKGEAIAAATAVAERAVGKMPGEADLVPAAAAHPAPGGRMPGEGDA